MLFLNVKLTLLFFSKARSFRNFRADGSESPKPCVSVYIKAFFFILSFFFLRALEVNYKTMYTNRYHWVVMFLPRFFSFCFIFKLEFGETRFTGLDPSEPEFFLVNLLHEYTHNLKIFQLNPHRG